MATPDIFLSYNREDVAFAKLFAEAFAKAGLDVWWDVALRAGEAYDEVTEGALRGAKAVVVLWSPRSVVSRWVRSEATLADRMKTLVPVMIEACERPIMFELTQTADLTHWKGDIADGSWQAFLNELLEFLGRETVMAPEMARAPVETRPARSGERGDAPSLAVLPFGNRSGLAEDEVFAIGMVEDVIDALSQGVNVRVIASSATARFRTGALVDLEAMGQQLGVRYLLEGNVRRIGSDLRVTAQLVEAKSGEILWTQKFDRPLEDLAALQEDLVNDVAAKLDAKVYRLEVERALAKPADLSAWEHATRAMAAYRQLNAENLILGLQEAQCAVDIAPDYGIALAMLALSKGNIYNLLTPYDPEAEKPIQALIDRALASAPDNAPVNALAGTAQYMIGKPAEALAMVNRALRLRPGYGPAHYSYGVANLLLDNTGEALRGLDDFYRMEPDSHLQYIAMSWRWNAHARRGDWEEAEAAVDRSIAFNPDFSNDLCNKAVLLERRGQSAEAIAMMSRVRELEPFTQLWLWELRNARWFANNPVADEVIAHMREVWTAMEAATPLALASGQ